MRSSLALAMVIVVSACQGPEDAGDGLAPSAHEQQALADAKAMIDEHEDRLEAEAAADGTMAPPDRQTD